MITTRFFKVLEPIKPELKGLNNIAQTNIEKGIQHITNVVESKNTFSKTVAREIVKIINEGPDKTSEIVNSTAEQLNSIAEKTVEKMKESKNPIVQQTASIVDNNANIIINKTKDIINQAIQNVDKTRNNVEKEIIKEVIKTKVNKGFWNFFNNFFAKIKQFASKLFKSSNNS